MKPSILSTMQLFPEWNKRLIEDSIHEESQSHVKFLGDKFRRILWDMCLWFGCTDNGVPGQACQLLEHYLFKMMHNVGHDYNSNQFPEQMYARMPLNMASCITLVAKMNNRASRVVAKKVHIILKQKNINCSVADLIADEFHIYSSLDFRLRLWTNVEIGLMLAVEVDYPLNLLKEVAITVDTAEYKRNRINRKILRDPRVRQSSSSGVVLSLHLAAGAVAAAARLSPCGLASDDMVPRLALLTRAPCNYLKHLQDAVTAICIDIIKQ